MSWTLVFQIAVLTCIGLAAALLIAAVIVTVVKDLVKSDGPEAIEVHFTEDGDLLKYDELTLFRVREALSEAGVPDWELENCINEMLSAGILFRERAEY